MVLAGASSCCDRLKNKPNKRKVVPMLKTRILPPTEQAHSTPLLIKNLLLSGVRYEASQEIVYRDISRYDYATFIERIHRLAGALTAAGPDHLHRDPRR